MLQCEPVTKGSRSAVAPIRIGTRIVDAQIANREKILRRTACQIVVVDGSKKTGDMQYLNLVSPSFLRDHALYPSIEEYWNSGLCIFNSTN